MRQTERFREARAERPEERDWARVEQLLESGASTTATVTQVNRGGVVVQFGELRGFVPNSHLTSIPRGISREQRRAVKAELIGHPLSLRVIEIDRRRRQLVLTERDIDPRRRVQLWETLTAGQRRTGVVRSILAFGAFVDLGGIDGLLHISELDWKHVAHPGDLLEVGQEIEVQVLRVDKRRERVRLSRKRLLPDPWPVVTAHLSADQIIQGTVSRALRSGLLVDIGQGVEGLLCFSEMRDPEQTRAALTPGSPIWVRVIHVDQKRRHIALGMSECQPGRRPTAIRTLWQKVVGLLTG